MSLMKFEQKWKTSLTSILEELDESEYKKMLFSLDKIHKSLKTDRSREEMPQIIIQYYGVEQSVLAIKKVMDLIPRKDAAVQAPLRPFVDQLKKKRQTKNKDKKEISKPDKKRAIKVPAKVEKEAQMIIDLKPASSVAQISAQKMPVNVEGTVKGIDPGKPVKSKQEKTGTQSKGTKVKPKTTKKRAIKVPAKVEKEAQMIIDLKPASSVAQISAQKMPVNVEGTVKGIDPGKPVKSKQEKTGTQSKGTKVKPETTKVQSDAVQIGRITITRIIKSTKTKFHLEAEFNNKQQTLVVTSRLLEKACGFKLEGDFKERLLDVMPVSTEAKIQGNKITELKNM